jgi:hypothetical protein
LPLAACIVIALALLPSGRISAEAVPTVEPAPAMERSSSANPPSGSGIASETPTKIEIHAADYPYVIAWKKGAEDLTKGNQIEITEIRGTKPTFELGNRYFVRGRYRLASAARGKLAFYISASGLDAFTSGEEAGQSCVIESGEGEFALSRYFECEGSPHISFYDENGSNAGGVYFSDGTPPKPAQPTSGEEQWQTATDRRRGLDGLNLAAFSLKCRADEGDRAAALQLAGNELARETPNRIQAYRWLYVAGQTDRAAEILAALEPEERREAERVTAAYMQRPTARTNGQ